MSRRDFLQQVDIFAGASAAEQKDIYGLNEYTRIQDFDLEMPAKLDTGAMTASLSAQRIQRFERDDVPVDFYGVGSSLFRGSFDFTADVVRVDGRASARRP